EDVLDRDVLPAELPGRDRAVVEDEAGDVEARERHHAGGDGLVAADDAHEPVEQVALGHELDRVGDQVAADERRAHPGRAHRDAVRDGDRVELDRRAAGGPNAVLDVDRELALVVVARHRLDPRRRDADERLREVLVRVADRLQHRARGRAVDAVGEEGAAALGGVGRARVDAHSPRLLCSAGRTGARAGLDAWRAHETAAPWSLTGAAPWSATRSQSTCASGKRDSSSEATLAARSLPAQTTTAGPEPESVTPAAPRGREAWSSSSSGASGSRKGSCSRSWNAAARRSGSEAAMAAPSSAACAAAAAASACGSVAGRRARDSSVLTRERGATMMGASGRSPAIRAAWAPEPFRQIRQTPPRRAAARLSGC